MKINIKKYFFLFFPLVLVVAILICRERDEHTTKEENSATQWDEKRQILYNTMQWAWEKKKEGGKSIESSSIYWNLTHNNGRMCVNAVCMRSEFVWFSSRKSALNWKINLLLLLFHDIHLWCTSNGRKESGLNGEEKNLSIADTKWPKFLVSSQFLFTQRESQCSPLLNERDATPLELYILCTFAWIKSFLGGKQIATRK